MKVPIIGKHGICDHVNIVLYRMSINTPLIFLQKRTKDAPTYPGLWSMFGGGVKPQDKTVKEALDRETRDELDYRLENPVWVMAHRYKSDDKGAVRKVYIEEFNPNNRLFTPELDYPDKFDSNYLHVLEGEKGAWLPPSVAVTLDMIPFDRTCIAYLDVFLHQIKQ